MTNSFSMNANEITNNRYFDGLTVGTTAYQRRSTDDGLHSHSNPTICFLLHGGGVERRSQKSYERYAGDLRFYYAEELHQSTIQVFPSKCVNLEIEPKFLNQYEISENIINSAVMENLDAKFLMLKIHNELLISDALTNPSVKVLLLEMLEERAKSNRKRPDWITTLYELLNDRWSENLSLEDLSMAVRVHPTTISKHFTKYFSCTLGEYIRKLRIKNSISLIKNTRLSLTEIAFQCGFADQSHFTRNFKRLTGFLPKDFKRL